MNCFKPCSFNQKCRNCEMGLSENREILYKFKGFGKYHNVILCNICFKERFGYTLDETTDFKNINDDPLGNKIIIYKRSKKRLKRSKLT